MAEPTRAEALKDYRYIDSTDTIIEAYQITEHTLFDEKGWPPWLHMQKVKGQQNVLYRDMAEPMSLFINMNGVEGQLGLNAWIIVGEDGSLSVMGEIEFGQFYGKVVPVPDVVAGEPADGKTDQEFYDSLTPELIEKLGITDPSTRDPHRPPPGEPVPVVTEAVEFVDQVADRIVVDEEVSALRAAMLDAIVALKPTQSKAGEKAKLTLQVALDTAHEGGLQWCDCNPGQCDESTTWGCRVKSPLL